LDTSILVAYGRKNKQLFAGNSINIFFTLLPCGLLSGVNFDMDGGLLFIGNTDMEQHMP
jgi:hypothetical protein